MVSDCDVEEQCIAPTTNEITLNYLYASSGCETFTHCAVAQNNFPSTSDIRIKIRTNGPSTGATTQTGIYLTGVNVYDYEGNYVPYYIPGSGIDPERFGTWYGTASESYSDRVSDLDCTFQATYFQTVIPQAEVPVRENDKLRFCINYQVHPYRAVKDTNVTFWMDHQELTGTRTTITSRNTTGASLIERSLDNSLILDDCTGDNQCDNETVKKIWFEDIKTDPNSQCKTYYHCAMSKNNFPANEVSFRIKTHGSAAGSSTQQGVYLKEVNVFDQDDSLVLNYMVSDPSENQEKGTWYGERDELYSSRVTDTDCTYSATYYQATILREGVVEGPDNYLRFCFAYQLDPAKVNRNSHVTFWVDHKEFYLGTVTEKMNTAAKIQSRGSLLPGLNTLLLFE